LDKYEVRLMNQALRDLDDIYAYIAGNLLEPGVAAEMVDALESEILSLEYLPYRCSERRTGSFANSGYRQLMVKNYIVIYRIDEANKQVLMVTWVSAKFSLGGGGGETPPRPFPFMRTSYWTPRTALPPHRPSTECPRW